MSVRINSTAGTIVGTSTAVTIAGT
jgi:hypothetical protein